MSIDATWLHIRGDRALSADGIKPIRLRPDELLDVYFEKTVSALFRYSSDLLINTRRLNGVLARAVSVLPGLFDDFRLHSLAFWSIFKHTTNGFAACELRHPVRRYRFRLRFSTSHQTHFAHFDKWWVAAVKMRWYLLGADKGISPRPVSTKLTWFARDFGISFICYNIIRLFIFYYNYLICLYPLIWLNIRASW